MANPETQETMQQLKQEFADFVAREKELAKAELGPAVKNAAIGSGLFAGVGLFLVHGLWMLIIGLALLLGWALTAWTALSAWGGFTLGFLGIALFSFLVAFILLKLGSGRMKKVKAPSATIEEAGATLSAMIDAATGKRAKAEVIAMETIGDPVPKRSA